MSRKNVGLGWNSSYIFLKNLRFSIRASSRAGNSLIGFLSESLSFLRKNERMSDSLKKMSNLLILSLLVSDLSDSLMVAHFG